MDNKLIITDDFNSIRQCGTIDEITKVVEIIASANPDIAALDAASPDLTCYQSAIGTRIGGTGRV